jgi:hypothetical protein
MLPYVARKTCQKAQKPKLHLSTNHAFFKYLASPLTFLIHVHISSSTPHAGSALTHGAAQPTVNVHAVNVARVVRHGSTTVRQPA